MQPSDSVSNSIIFQNRNEAGRVLGGILSEYAAEPSVLVLALPRGGVPVASEVASALHAPLDIFLVRKLPVPHQRAIALGAVASCGILLLDNDTIGMYGVSPTEIQAAESRERGELNRRELGYRGERPSLDVTGHTVILVDDGLATGSTVLTAVGALKTKRPRQIVVAIPVGAVESLLALRREVDRVVCAHTPTPFFSIGHWYRDFSPVMDREICDFMREPSGIGAAAH